MLIRAIRQAVSSGEFYMIPIALLASAFLVFCIIPLHEYAHAWAAFKMGDDTPAREGRLTMNPMAHVDPVGGIMIALIGIGWGKPVTSNPSNYRNRKWGNIFVAAAGPLSNILAGWLFIFLMTLTNQFATGLFGQCASLFFYYAGWVCVQLGILNLFPIPLFDGYTILSQFLSNKARYWVMENQQIISIIIIVLLFTNVLTTPIIFLTEKLTRFFFWVSALPFA